jgi:hypothetical protein
MRRRPFLVFHTYKISPKVELTKAPISHPQISLFIEHVPPFLKFFLVDLASRKSFLEDIERSPARRGQWCCAQAADDTVNVLIGTAIQTRKLLMFHSS